MKFKLIILFFTILSSLAHSKTTGYKHDSSKTYILNPVIITGTKVEISRNDAPLSISVIPQDKIEMSGAFSVLSMLTTEVPGLFVTQRGNIGFGIGTGAAGTISIRGISGSPNTGVLMLIDGRPDFMGMFGHPLPDAYSLDNVQRVEVIRGPASYLYGTNAMGGVINIITKRMATDGFSTKLSASYGTFNTQQYKAQHGGKINSFNYFTSASYHNTDGHRPYSSYRSQTYSANAGYNMNENYRISAGGNMTKFKTYNPGTTSAPLINNWVEALRGGFNLDIDNAFENVSGTLKIHGNFGEHKIYDGWHSFDNTIGMMLYENFKFFEGNISTFGFDYKRFGGRAKNEINNKDYGKHFVYEYVPYVHMQQFVNNKLAMSAALRLENNSIYGKELVPQLGLTYHINPSFSVRGLTSKGFRSPTIRELYLFPAPTIGLKPENLWNYEIGISNRFADWLSAEVTAYQNEGNNMIRTEGIFPNLKLTNSGKFRHQGVELEIKSLINDNLTLSSNYSYLNPENETFSSPGNKASFYVNYKYENLSLSINGTYISKLYGKDYKEQKLSNVRLISATASYKVFNFLTTSLSGENLLNQDYEFMFGYPMPKRNFTFNLSTIF